MQADRQTGTRYAYASIDKAIRVDKSIPIRADVQPSHMPKYVFADVRTYIHTYIHTGLQLTSSLSGGLFHRQQFCGTDSPSSSHSAQLASRNEGGRGGRNILPSGWEGLDPLVVPGETMDPALHKDQTKFRVLVLTIPIQMLADSDSLLDQVVQVFWQLGCETVSFQDAEDFVACYHGPRVGAIIIFDFVNIVWYKIIPRVELHSNVFFLIAPFGCMPMAPGRGRVTVWTCGIPKLSRRVTPICEGVKPFLASLQIWSLTSSVFIFTHVGARRRYGTADDEMPLPLPYIRPIVGEKWVLLQAIGS